MALDRQPDLVLMDLLMPEMDGVLATRMIRQQQPDLPIIALSSSTDYALIGTAVLAGASTYLHKGNKPNQLIAHIKALVAGRVILSPAVMGHVLMHLPAPDALEEPLTPDEISLLRLLAAGHSDDEIAQQLQQDISTVAASMRQISSKLSSSTRLLALLRAMQLGLVERPTPA